jgi:hypothetical protein
MLDPATTTPTAQLKWVELCYRFAYLEGRRAMGRLLDTGEEKELAYLRQVLQGDAPFEEHARRSTRRFALLARAAVKGKGGSLATGLVLNISGDGMYVLTTSRQIAVGDTIQVKLGAMGEVEYLFTCIVTRQEAHEALIGLGLSFCCVPVEMRRARFAA